ncbi:serine hydrolase domain-containing protein [Microcella humidisoli]|uniref:Beta-lactamase family protein n=1 Tax=Microcella humidisoli TaxID=2963406 RepID=A0ABY5FVC1_9MICO|nr:serine hydrolase domain-containing protein [Microcella humidisoli]UTT61731.1 beta-lactamase family protein [Microcella humidisoli]
MATPRALALTVLLAALLAGCGASPAGGERAGGGADAQSIQHHAMRSAASDAVLVATLADDAPGCSAAVGRDATVLWAGARGLADLTAGTPLTTGTRFEVASVSKQFTAALVLSLARDGLLRLDDPVSTHVSGLPAWGRTVTLEQLLHHTARLPDFWIELEAVGIGFSDPADQQTVLAAIRRVDAPLDGTGYAYANSHYVLLAAAAESVTGEPFATALATRVLQPLGIEATVEPALAAADIAVGHGVDSVPVTAAWAVAGPVGIVTTPSELVRWAAQFAPGGLLAVADAGAVDSSAGATDAPDDDRPGERYGAGIRIAADGTLFHAGRWGGSVSVVRVSADRELAIAVTCNQRDAPRMELADTLTELWVGAGHTPGSAP